MPHYAPSWSRHIPRPFLVPLFSVSAPFAISPRLMRAVFSVPRSVALASWPALPLGAPARCFPWVPHYAPSWSRHIPRVFPASRSVSFLVPLFPWARHYILLGLGMFPRAFSASRSVGFLVPLFPWARHYILLGLGMFPRAFSASCFVGFLVPLRGSAVMSWHVSACLLGVPLRGFLGPAPW